MNSTKQEIESLIGHIKDGAVVVTVNKRLASKITSSFEAGLLDSGVMGWTPAEVYSLNQWVKDIWSDYSLTGGAPLLSDSRSKSLFNKIVKEDKKVSSLGASLRSIAVGAYQAMGYVHEYSINIEGGIFVTKEVGSYLAWSGEYKKQVEKLNLTDPIVVKDKVINLIKDGLVEVPPKIIFIGFDDMTPKVKSLVDVLDSAGSVVSLIQSNVDKKISKLDRPKNIKAYSFKDQKDEVVAVARAIRDKYKKGSKIGIIVPDMEQYKDLIMREFSAELNPKSVIPKGGGEEENYESFNISLGGSLGSEFVVSVALSVLSVDGRKQNVEDLINILSSPYLSPQDTFKEVMDLDLVLRKENYLKITLNKLNEKIKKVFKEESLSQEKVENWLNFIKDQSGNGKLVPSKWSEKFSKFLDSIAWPNANGKTDLNQNEHQATEAWLKVLEDFSTLDDILGEVPIKTALSELQRMTSESLYQVETPNCDIEVMGMFESAGIYFDHIWIMGAHREALPFKPKANPFIPFYKQREAGMSQSSYDGTVFMGKAMLQRIFSSADEFTVTYPEEYEGRPVSVSPFFRDLEINTLEEVEGKRVFDVVRELVSLEDMDDDEDLPVSKGELKSISKGTAVIKNQSACPFRSFALHRLRAESLDCPEPGLNAMDKGTVIHEALKFFWQDVGDLKGLKLLVEQNSLSKKIRSSVEGALKKQLPWSRGRYFKMEADRVSGILELWLAEELKRGDFIVKSVESSKSIELGGFSLNVKIDRIDELGDGTSAVIDYKTGVCNKNDWLTDRPKEPQMPIYSMTGDFDAVAFGSLKVDKVKFVGSSKLDNALPGVKSFDSDTRWTEKIEGVENWEELRESWSKTLINIGADFVKGNNSVNPNNIFTSESACTYCDVKPLCRVFEVYDEEVSGGDDE